MSATSLPIVVFCKRCGAELLLSASTTAPDPDGTLLAALVKGAAEKALCDDCQKARLYYIQEGRLLEFEATVKPS